MHLLLLSYSLLMRLIINERRSESNDMENRASISF